MKRIFFFALAWLMAGTVFAQYERLGGVYYAYPVTKTELTEAPEGYEPFYISHYGRHGSRWMTSDERYLWLCNNFEDRKNLTKLGKDVARRLAKAWRQAKGNGGKLSPLGAKQHQGIACRMYHNFPQLFTPESRITARSSVVDRCRRSMLAFLGELESLGEMSRPAAVTDSADMAWIAYTSPEAKALEQRTQIPLSISPDRFVKALFIDPSKVENPVKLFTEMHTLASDMQDVELPLSFYDIFTEQELLAVYEQNNQRMMRCNGDHILNEGIPARSAISLWQRIEADAAAAVERASRQSMTGSNGKAVGADLRFGHDTNLYRLLTLMGVVSEGVLEGRGKRGEVREYSAASFRCAEAGADAAYRSNHHSSFLIPHSSFNIDRMDEILPMAANLQMIFYRNQEGQVIVQLLLNERTVRLKYLEDNGGFYRWDDIRNAMVKRLHDLEHLRQLCALNTMVGTAPANTKTAGRFGKGSEEHGQTLPAVLSPNGQNFWTPQTRDTEKKCLAPYYYTDSLLQGFRNSHWIVGGCTQDYGSFTVAAISEKLRLHPEQRATRFSHSEEISHPHYYAVRLPDERLQVELTGASHAAMMRIIPEQDQLVHVIVNHNSDEGEGDIDIDLKGKRVFGHNPVHRIYQGWGQPAGFSGHFLLKYTNDIVDAGKDSSCVWLTFQGKAHQPILLQMASSFTGLEGAETNLFNETRGKDFETLAQTTATDWIGRLHTIDVEDSDSSRVNQFYGSLYRASFLPREMSDTDGSFPRFAGSSLERRGKREEVREYSAASASAETSADSAYRSNHHSSFLIPHSSLLNKFYGDFSMWDTYRALHPLYNIIAPKESADMMQSLVTMYEQGGWLPIFPCWNSYTAAMIGDHCSVALADAYVKGIRGFNAEKAYEAMRKNAFETPASYDDYKNGMGRRALTSYLKYGYIPLEDSVKEAFHQDEQTSRTLEYAFDDFAVAQMARLLGKTEDYELLMKRSGNWRNVINPATGYCDGRHAPRQFSRKKSDGGLFEGNTDFIHRKPYITEGATCHYTWYVPQDVEGLVQLLGGKEKFEAKLDSMFSEQRYWHGNEPCHQIAYLYDFIGKREKTVERVAHILDTEYNDTAGGLSGNDDAGQMSAWYIFSSIGFYPVCPATDRYMLSAPRFSRVTLNLQNGRRFTITPESLPKDRHYLLHSEILAGN